jgi:hypothetical protein
VIQRDLHAEFIGTLALIGASIERWATEFRHLQRTEVREAEEGVSIAKELLDTAVKHFNGIYLITPFLRYEISLELL